MQDMLNRPIPLDLDSAIQEVEAQREIIGTRAAKYAAQLGTALKRVEELQADVGAKALKIEELEKEIADLKAPVAVAPASAG